MKIQSYISNSLSYIIIAILLIIVGWFGYTNNQLRYQKNNLEQNWTAINDSLHIYHLKNDVLLYEKNAYILKVSELNEILNITQQEIKEIKRELNSSINYIAKLEGFVKIDTIYTNDTVYFNNHTIETIKFGYKDEWLSLNGMTTLGNNKSQTIISNINLPLDIQTGLTEDKTIFVKTNNPYVNIRNINGAMINNDKKIKFNFHHEFQVGVGFQYGLFNGQIDFGPQIGYGFVIEF